jgi:hypothetical protein
MAEHPKRRDHFEAQVSHDPTRVEQEQEKEESL